MSSNFTDNTNYFASTAINFCPYQSVPPRNAFHGSRLIAAESIQSVGPYNLRLNTLPSHHGPPPQCFDDQTFTTSHEQQQSLVRDFRTNRQCVTAIRGDVNQHASQPLFSSFPGNSAPVHPETMGTAHGTVENSHTFTGTYNPEPQPFLSGINIQPSYYPSLKTNLAFGNMQQSLTMGFKNAATANGHALHSPTNSFINPSVKDASMFSRVSNRSTVNWRCNLSGCQYVSRSKRSMERHCSNLRHGGRREHKCQFCGNEFVREDTLNRHVKKTRCSLRQEQLLLTRTSEDWELKAQN